MSNGLAKFQCSISTETVEVYKQWHFAGLGFKAPLAKAHIESLHIIATDADPGLYDKLWTTYNKSLMLSKKVYN